MSVKDHNQLFKQDEYKDQFERKREFECAWPKEKVNEVSEWTKGWEYRKINFAREHIKINPAKACQPLGAVYCASGFEGAMPFVQGAQGCVAYFRSHLSRHFKEPFAAISTSMTEDAAVLTTCLRDLKTHTRFISLRCFRCAPPAWPRSSATT